MKNKQALYFNSNPFFELGHIHLSEEIAKHFIDFPPLDLNKILDVHRFVSWASDDETNKVLQNIHDNEQVISKQLAEIGFETIQVICITSVGLKHTVVMTLVEFLTGQSIFNTDELFAFNAEVSQCQNHSFR